MKIDYKERCKSCFYLFIKWIVNNTDENWYCEYYEQLCKKVRNCSQNKYIERKEK